ncbi:piggyBac transposable element-derived protein 4-like [Vespula squamosa]|uniref:PiggyBac transposable element-derived protein 4-like n=1 Tax=Vespula squamosa TaxID=30214 RepID=A0ABD2B907_VESSQ
MDELWHTKKECSLRLIRPTEKVTRVYTNTTRNSKLEELNLNVKIHQLTCSQIFYYFLHFSIWDLISGLKYRDCRWSHTSQHDFALVSHVWNRFIENSQISYDMNLTVDEQLFPTIVRCKFTQYVPSKPDKFDIKFWLVSITDNKYIINGFPYLGKEETRPSSIPLGEFVVLKLVEPFTRCWRHVTTDNFFTNASLVTKLLAQRTTLFEIIRSNRRELAKLAKSAKDELERFSTILSKSSNCILTIYKSKPTKKVTILSSKHKRIQIRLCKKKKTKQLKFV